MTASLTQAEIGSVTGVSPSEISRIEHGQSPRVPFVALALIAAAVGLELPLRAFPGGDAIRDAGQQAPLTRFRARLTHLQHVAEVPLGIPRDGRARDEIASGRGWSIAVEAESRIRDLQALERRLALKLRDGRRDRLILLVADTRHDRHALRLGGDSLAGSFPLAGRAALAALEDSRCPSGSAVILL